MNEYDAAMLIIGISGILFLTIFYSGENSQFKNQKIFVLKMIWGLIWIAPPLLKIWIKGVFG